MLTEAEIAEAEANGHSIFGGSKWHRALPCTQSVLREIGLPDTAGVEAAEGTVAHEIGAQMLELGLLPTDFGDDIGKVYTVNGFEITLTAAMLHHVEQYAVWCRDAEVPGCQVLIEHRVDYSHLTPIPDQGGSVDDAVLAPGLMVITDLKYGEGVQVFAERNYQMLAYALGLYEEWNFIYGFEKIVLRICQPRLGHFDVWETTADELLYFGDYAKQQMAEAWSPNAKFAPSEAACKFCKCAKARTCAAALTLMDRIADDTFEDLTATPLQTELAVERMAAEGYVIRARPPKEFTSREIMALLDLQGPVNTVFKALYDELSHRAFLGEKLEGWGITPGRKTRFVADPDGAAEELDFMSVDRAEVYKKALRSPAELEEILVSAGLRKKDAVQALAPYVTSIPGQPTLARLTKGKQAIADLDGDVFEDVRENT